MFCSKRYQKEKLRVCKRKKFEELFGHYRQRFTYCKSYNFCHIEKTSLTYRTDETSDNFFYAVFDIKIIVLGSMVQNNGTSCFWYQFNNLQAHINTRYGVRNKKKTLTTYVAVFVLHLIC